MKQILTVILIVFTIVGCKSQKHAVVETKDSVRVETKIERFFIHDTVTIEIPAQRAERTTFDSVSHLENDYAISDVRINSDGSLSHTLNTKPQKMDIDIDTPVEVRDSIIYRSIEKKVPEYIEKELTWWQKVCIRWFPWSLLFIGLAIVYKSRKWLYFLARKLL